MEQVAEAAPTVAAAEAAAEASFKTPSTSQPQHGPWTLAQVEHQEETRAKESEVSHRSSLPMLEPEVAAAAQTERSDRSVEAAEEVVPASLAEEQSQTKETPEEPEPHPMEAEAEVAADPQSELMRPLKPEETAEQGKISRHGSDSQPEQRSEAAAEAAAAELFPQVAELEDQVAEVMAHTADPRQLARQTQEEAEVAADVTAQVRKHQPRADQESSMSGFAHE